MLAYGANVTNHLSFIAWEALAVGRRKIQLTDDLIDQIVYKLYGLTEEIGVVGGLDR